MQRCVPDTGCGPRAPGALKKLILYKEIVLAILQSQGSMRLAEMTGPKAWRGTTRVPLWPYLPGWPLTVPSVPPFVPPLPPNSNGTKLSKRGWEDGLSQAGVGVEEGCFSAADVPRGQSDEQGAHSEALEGFLVITMVGFSPRSFICSLRAWG